MPREITHFGAAFFPQTNPQRNSASISRTGLFRVKEKQRAFMIFFNNFTLPSPA